MIKIWKVLITRQVLIITSNTEALADFSIVFSLASLPSFLSISIMTVLYTKMTSLYLKEEYDEVKQFNASFLLITNYILMFLLIPLCFFFKDIINVFASKYSNIPTSLVILLSMFSFLHTIGISFQYIGSLKGETFFLLKRTLISFLVCIIYVYIFYTSFNYFHASFVITVFYIIYLLSFVTFLRKNNYVKFRIFDYLKLLKYVSLLIIFYTLIKYCDFQSSILNLFISSLIACLLIIAEYKSKNSLFIEAKNMFKV